MITDTEVENLKSLSQLRTLYLTKTPLTDQSLKVLFSLPNLEMLDVSETAITREGLRRYPIGDCIVRGPIGL
jgi:Leucine-rich repeat (LRR) protein